MKNRDDIPFKKTPGSITYDQLGEFLTKTLDKVHKEEMKKFKQKQKNKKK